MLPRHTLVTGEMLFSALVRRGRTLSTPTRSKHVSGMEERVASIEGILEQMDKRLNHMETEVRELRIYVEAEIRELRRGLDELRRDLNIRFFWLLGVQISMWVTIILAILFK
jgi:chromosome segregation ATPase